MTQHDADTDDSPARVPPGVLRGIDDIAHGRTVSKADLEAVLTFTETRQDE